MFTMCFNKLFNNYRQEIHFKFLHLIIQRVAAKYLSINNNGSYLFIEKTMTR